MPNNTALALYFGDLLTDQSHPRDGILFYANAAKNTVETDIQTAAEKEKEAKEAQAKSGTAAAAITKTTAKKEEKKKGHKHTKWAEDLNSFGETDVQSGQADQLRNVTADTSQYALTGMITITAYRPLDSIDDDDFRFVCSKIANASENFVGTWMGRTEKAIT